MAENVKSRPHRANGVLPEKKRKREARIVQAATDLFARDGYAETSIEAIAGRADVAVGTVYNYFQNKPALLMRVLTSGRSRSLEASAAVASAPPDDPVEAIYQLVAAQMHGANRHDKTLWRVIHATAALEPEAFGLHYLSGKEQFTSHIVKLLETLRDRGQLEAKIDVPVAAKTVKYVASEVFRRYVADDEMSIDDAAIELKSIIRFTIGRVVTA
jgi:AcrR family transcriptional regulator